MMDPYNDVAPAQRMLLAVGSREEGDVGQTLVTEASHLPRPSSRLGDYGRSLAATSGTYPSYSFL